MNAAHLYTLQSLSALARNRMLSRETRKLPSWARTCNMCAAKRQCYTCGTWLLERYFTRNAWKQSRDRICNACRHCKTLVAFVRQQTDGGKHTEKNRKRRAQAAVDACWAEIRARKKPTMPKGLYTMRLLLYCGQAVHRL